MEFHTKGAIFQIENDPITMKLWVFERDHYMCIQKENKIFSSRKYIFVIECRHVQLMAGNKIDKIVVVCFSMASHLFLLLNSDSCEDGNVNCLIVMLHIKEYLGI